VSEYINNVSKRKEILKNVIRQLHQGKSVEEVQAEFGVLTAQASSAEIAEAEQTMIAEGLPVEEIQRLCDVHVAVFRQALDQQPTAESIPGHPLHTFRSENKLVVRFLAEIDRTVEHLGDGDNLVLLRSFALQLEKLSEYERHYSRKENLLFPYMEKYGFQGHAKVMWGIHDTIRAKLRLLKGMLDSIPSAPVTDLKAVYNEMAGMIREMAYKEEKILFPAALQHLSEEDWQKLFAQENEIGYFMVTPGNEWRPKKTQETAPALESRPIEAPLPAATEPAASGAGELGLNTGALTLEQINLMLRNLPVDITFVDENDTVRYFSQTHERIFARTEAIIGRKVQNCHPPQSVDRVQKILDDFRTGQRSAAEFWINMGERMVYIRYFALRDANNNYRGTIEVTQDIAAIRQLEGERRLLDDVASRMN
jgi:PAS domain S-box-containing protein